MNNYELTLVLDGKNSGPKLKKVAETLEMTLKIFNGKIKSTKEIGVRDLAYKIGKSETGFFTFYELEMEPAGAKQLNEKLRIDPDVIRYLLIKSQISKGKLQTSTK
jgi:small subunit ribosomal protein S6